MVRLARRICALAAALVVASAGSAAAEQKTDGPAAGFGPKEILEYLATIFGERWKQVDIEDPFDQRCPQVTSLISFTGDSLGIIVPSYSLFNQPDRGSSVFFISIGPENSPDFSYSNGVCRYTVTVKRFDISSDGEREVGPKPVDRKRIQKQIAEALKSAETRETDLSTPIPIERFLPKAPASARPFDSGISRMGVTFDSAVGRIDFSGILYFAPWSVSMHLVNVPKEWMLESRRNHDLKTYEFDLSNSTARVRFVITKEVYAEGLWVKAFSE
jgi:hypothetical protein